MLITPTILDNHIGQLLGYNGAVHGEIDHGYGGHLDRRAARSAGQLRVFLQRHEVRVRAAAVVAERTVAGAVPRLEAARLQHELPVKTELIEVNGEWVATAVDLLRADLAVVSMTSFVTIRLRLAHVQA